MTAHKLNAKQNESDLAAGGICPLCSDRATLPRWIVQARADALGVLLPRLAHATVEELRAVWYNNDSKIIGSTLLARGSDRAMTVSSQELCRAALKANAYFVVLGHSHPASGAIASEEDLKVTDTMRTALATIGISLIDHLIVGHSGIWAWLAVQRPPKGWKRRLARLAKKHTRS